MTEQTPYLRIITRTNELDYTKIEVQQKLVVPVIVLDESRLAECGLRALLMAGVADCDAVEQTIESRPATFYSRSNCRIWSKGESSQNFLTVQGMYTDCDNDTPLISAIPAGPTCHNGTSSCFEVPNIGEYEE